jgi:hypothetical protein
VLDKRIAQDILELTNAQAGQLHGTFRSIGRLLEDARLFVQNRAATMGPVGAYPSCGCRLFEEARPCARLHYVDERASLIHVRDSHLASRVVDRNCATLRGIAVRIELAAVSIGFLGGALSGV